MKRLTVSCLAICAVNLSGCAQIVNFGDILWSETKSRTLSGTDKLMAALRPRSERKEPIFITDPVIAEYETVHTPAFNNKTAIDVVNRGHASLQPRPINGLEPLPAYPDERPAHTQLAHAQAIQTQPILAGGPAEAYNIYKNIPAQTSYSQPVSTRPIITQPAPTYSNQPNTQYSYANTASHPVTSAAQIAQMPAISQELPDLSYVKLSGRISADDWQDCEAQAGGYILADNAGFRLRPDFDYCMRAKGYVPESEAVSFMEAQLLP